MPKDANFNIAILLDVLNQIDLTDVDTLYLQLDGAGDNKCKTMMAFCAALVHFHVFKRVKVSFLPVGHTHEDIDQLFGRLALALRNRDVRTVAELLEVMRGCFHPVPVVSGGVPVVLDFTTWIDESMFAQWSNITKHRCFKFEH